jgi:hypothetical protein
MGLSSSKSRSSLLRARLRQAVGETGNNCIKRGCLIGWPHLVD